LACTFAAFLESEELTSFPDNQIRVLNRYCYNEYLGVFTAFS